MKPSAVRDRRPSTRRSSPGIAPEACAEALRAYRSLNDSPMQRRLRREHPAHIGVVYWNRNRVSKRTLVRELRRMKDLGFTFVRFHECQIDETAFGVYDFSTADLRMDAAAEAGIGVYPDLALAEPSRAALAARGLTPEQAERLGLSDSRVAEALRVRIKAMVERYRKHPALLAWLVGGEPSAGAMALGEDDAERFRAWLRSHYRSPADVRKAWATYPRQHPPLVDSWDQAVAAARRIRAKDGQVVNTLGLRFESYGELRDLMRFRADRMLDDLSTQISLIRKYDRAHPVCLGNHQLFINNAQLCWDIPESARLADVHFTSIHLSWHFEQTRGEVDRPVYMQARMTKDAIKAGMSSAYETTGGPVQYSGGYGNHMDPGLMRRLMCSYLAAGNQSIAFWVWMFRPGGVESGEYGMLTLSGAVSPWAREAGDVARAMRKYTEELWSLWEEPELGILRSWDTEAILAVEPRRFELDDGPSGFSRGTQQQHMRAIVGAGRTAIDDRIAFEYLSEREILEGIACAYPALYLPHVRACSDRLLECLIGYVKAGGRLLADVQIGFQDQWGKVRRRGKGTVLDRLFGAWVDNIHDARTMPQTVDGIEVKGFYGDLCLTKADAIKHFGDGRPAVAQANIGRGQATLIAFDPARECWLPGNARMQQLLADLCRGDAPRRWWTDAPIAVRRSGRKADHWFLINDGPARTAILRVYDRSYRDGLDVLAGEPIDVAGTIAVKLPAYSSVWARMGK